MKRVAFQFANPAPRAIAATALLAAIAFASPSRVASGDLAQAPASGILPTPAILADATSTQAPSATKNLSAPVTMANDSTETVEAQIKHLHKQLQITAAQEDMWKNVTEVMRDNADKLTSLAKARSEKAKTMTALDDLKSYAEIIEAQEAGLGKLLSVFTTLYDSMSDVQKKAADAEFREHHHHEHHN